MIASVRAVGVRALFFIRHCRVGGPDGTEGNTFPRAQAMLADNRTQFSVAPTLTAVTLADRYDGDHFGASRQENSPAPGCGLLRELLGCHRWHADAIQL
jgi:hypothetical protein